jgi:hypothetical protein
MTFVESRVVDSLKCWGRIRLELGQLEFRFPGGRDIPVDVRLLETQYSVGADSIV